MKTKLVFCAREQAETEHISSIDANEEFLFECPCGAFFKLPGHLDKKELAEALKTHKAHNEGQVSQDSIDLKNQKKLDLLD